MTSTHKTDRHAKGGRPRGRVPRAPKEETTFDAELQRYVMPSECSVTMLKAKQEVSEAQRKTDNSGNDENSEGTRVFSESS
jgi:hypothetical protein